MISSRITAARKKKRMPERELASMIGMSITGFRQAMSKDDFKASTLTLLSKALEVPVGFFFDEKQAEGSINDGNNNIMQTANGKNIRQHAIDVGYKHKFEKAEDKIKGLEELIKAKDKIIELLEREKLKN